MTDETSSDSPTGAHAARTERERWTLVAGLSLISMALSAYEIAPASVTPLVRASMDIDATKAGLVVGSMFGAAMLASLPLGAVLDRTNSRVAVAVAIVVSLLVGVWGWAAAERDAYYLLLASRVCGGVAFVVIWNASIDMVSRAVEASRRATAVGIFTASGPVGFALGQGGGPTIAAQFGWPAIFLVFNAIPLVGLAMYWPTSQGLGRTGSGSAPSLAEFGSVLRNRSVWLVGSLGFLAYSLYLFVNSWAPSFLTDEIGVTIGLSGLLVAVFPAVGVVSRVSSGLLSDRLFGGRRRPVLLLSFLLTVPALLVLGTLRSLAVLVAALLAAGFTVQLTLGLSFAYVRELVDSRVAATAVAFQTSLGLAGAFLAPIAGGALIEATSYETAFVVAGALGVVGVAVAWVVTES
ncbi:MFS transporter [Halobacterium wangiae]|uniref:MFS transporter n=1 Tax=Halobacterium wangiae TaxID=2902623 RepID=UPI001E6350CE|nr:MFS transporter [Halobacterium wangiae]